MINKPLFILIAGGAGFIGSHLSERLLKEGNRVICVDNFSSGSKNNIAGLLSDPSFSLLEHDIIEPLKINEPIDEIYNLASPASPKYYQERPIFTLLTNVLGTKNLLDLAKKHGAKFLQASSSEIYGNPLQHPQSEEYWGNVNPIGPRSCYDEGKRAAETLCADYARIHSLDIKIARIFNTYGPRMAQDDGRVISNFIVNALKNDDILVYGDGSQTRSFQYIDDLVAGLISFMKSGYRGPLNLGNPDEHSILEVAEMILKITGSKSKIKYKPLPEDDPLRRKPDISKAKQLLGWEPKIPFEEGLKKTIDFFRKQL